MFEVVVAAESWQRSVSAGLTPELMRCPTCHTVHADAGQHAVRRHFKHVCMRCGDVFSTASRLACVGNPLASIPMLKSIEGKVSVGSEPVDVDGSCLAVRGVGSC